jgi:hypothetical protein
VRRFERGLMVDDCGEYPMIVHLVDGTYELFRQHYGQASFRGGSTAASPVAATIGVLNSTIALLASGATHIGVATDHVVESFRNDLYDGYKTGEGLDEEILVQFPLVEAGLRALGVTLWSTKPMMRLRRRQPWPKPIPVWRRCAS